MCQRNIAGWVIKMDIDQDFVYYNPNTAQDAARLNNYLPVANSGLNIDKQTVTTESGETFLIKSTRFYGDGFNLIKAESQVCENCEQISATNHKLCWDCMDV